MNESMPESAADRAAVVGDFASCWAAYREGVTIRFLTIMGRLRQSEVACHQMDFYSGAKSVLMVIEAAERQGKPLPELVRRLQIEIDRFLQSRPK